MTDIILDNIYLILLLPFWIFLIIMFGRFFSVYVNKKIIYFLTQLSSFIGILFCGTVLWKLEPDQIIENSIPFIKINDFILSFGLYVDKTALIFAFILFLTSFAVQMFSISFMRNEKKTYRFYALLNLFNFTMTGLFFSPNLFQTYVFWELVGVVSYLLIGFEYFKKEKSIASKKVLIINRIGDTALITAIILSSYFVYEYSGNLNLTTLSFSDMPAISTLVYAYTLTPLFWIICSLFIIGAAVKSAQFPFYNWLIDAMEAPTPVSALIHSATMVVAGVYLLCRLYPLYSLNETVLSIISLIGIVTAIICSISACSQTDLKKMLAYSTSAQLGLMFLALGACSITTTMIHLTAHSFIKAMLFLIAGIIITSQKGNQDIKLMGGLRVKLPTSAITYLIGAFSLSGLLFAGFASKDLILGNLLSGKHYIYASLFLIVAFMTAYYLFRAYFYIFEGESRAKVDFKFKEPDVILNIIVGIFAITIIFLWFIFPKSQNLLFKVVTYIIGISAISTSYLIYVNRGVIRKIPVIFDISYNGFYIDNIYSGLVNGYNKMSRIAYLIDKYFFEAISYLFVLNIRFFSWILSKLQTGNVQSYLAYSLLIIMLCFGALLLIYNLIVYFSEV